jgi:hypothetical protein
MIPDDVIEDIDPAEVGRSGCLLPTGDGVTCGTNEEDE